jgi:hypothetical protein
LSAAGRAAFTFGLVLFLIEPGRGNSAAESRLPDAQELKNRALASMRKSEKALENYSCEVDIKASALKADGSVKKHETRREERFYVNAVPISHVLSRNGRELTGAEAKKEQERVDSEVEKYSDRAQAIKRQERAEREADLFLRSQQLLNGRREARGGRSTLIFDLAGDPKFHPQKLEERVMQALTGMIWIDEETGAPIELRAGTSKDIKIGGGLIASLHKGFQIHFVQQQQTDGVWLPKVIEGNGQARAVLFLHPRFQFREVLDKCHLFSVETKESVKPPQELVDHAHQ